MNGEASVKTVWFDRHGDKRLLVEDTVLVVSSKAMSLVCEPWNAMLGPEGKFIEAQCGNSKELSLPEDDLNALLIILRIAHLDFSNVPTKLDFDDLLAVAVLTDKYLATHIVRPWIAKWIESLKNTVGVDGYEGWLWISWEFGYSDIFTAVVQKLILESTTNSSGECLTAEGKVLEDHMPPGVTDHILNVRSVLLGRLLAIVDGYLDQYSKSSTKTICKAQKPGCDALLCGSLIIQLKKLQLWPRREDPTKMAVSVKSLAETLQEINILSYPGHEGSGFSSYYPCNFEGRLKDSVRAVIANIPLLLLDPHKFHLREQYLKCQSG